MGNLNRKAVFRSERALLAAMVPVCIDIWQLKCQLI
jgi:hypothetical protein